MKTIKSISILLVICLVLLLATPTFAYADTAVTLSCPDSATAGDDVTVSGTAPAGEGISIKVIDSEGNIVYYDLVIAESAGNYSYTFTLAENLVDETVTVIAGYGDKVATHELSVTEPENNGGGRRRGRRRRLLRLNPRRRCGKSSILNQYPYLYQDLFRYGG